MAPPAWARLSELSGDPRYLNYAIEEYLATRNYLYDETIHLFYRDSRFFNRRSTHGNKVFWSRGNGWVFAGIPLLLEAMPDSHPAYPELIQLYRDMAGQFVAIQHPEGFWAPSLLDVNQSPHRETSGTAFITFGLAWGVNRQLLPGTEFRRSAITGWNNIRSAVDPSGKPGWVQQIGNAPDEVRATDTQLYGSGAFLLAASEILKLEGRQ